MKPERIKDFAPDGPFAVGECQCGKCMSQGGRWLVYRAEYGLLSGFVSGLEYKHKRSAQRIANELNLAYASHIMVQP